MALSKKMIIIGSSVGLILLIVVILSVVMSKYYPTQKVTTRAPTTKVPTTRAPTTKVPNNKEPNSLLKNQYLTTIYTGKSSLNKAIKPSEFLMSPNDISRLYLQSDGNIVLFKRTTNSLLPSPLWFSDSASLLYKSKVPTDGRISLKLVFENNGDLVLYYYSNNNPKNLVPVYRTKTQGRGGNKLVLQDDGNLVIYNNTKPLWSSSQGML
jgi:hypothetical protein